MTPAVGSLLWTASTEAIGDELDLHITATHLLDGSYSPTGAAIVLAISVVQPESRGTLRLASRDPNQAPVIDNNYLGTDRDARRMLEGVRLARAIAREGSPAATRDACRPAHRGASEACGRGRLSISSPLRVLGRPGVNALGEQVANAGVRHSWSVAGVRRVTTQPKGA
jgi:choline dehydrogenase-like flavoprotein